MRRFRVPASGDPFRWPGQAWADIDASGPFLRNSPRYNPQDGCCCGAAGDRIAPLPTETHKSLRKVGELVEFDGALAAPPAELLNGPCCGLESHGFPRRTGVAVRVEALHRILSL